MADYRWKPIEKWQGPWQPSTLPEVFAEFRKHLDEASLHAFMERSAREWSIETGQIEGAFDLDRGVTTALIEEGFNAALINDQRNGLSRERVHAILLDTKAVLDGLYVFIKSEQLLTVHYIRSLHHELMRNVEDREVYMEDAVTKERRAARVPLNKGVFKQEPNNPTRKDGSKHDFCPPHEVDTEMSRLVEIHAELQREGAPPEVRAAWLHHAFTQIHPFEDGNGRVARALASLVLIQAGLPAFTVVREMRTRYIHALESADHGNPQPLLDFFESALYRQLFLLSNSIRPAPPTEVKPTASLDEILKAAEQRLLVQQKRASVEWEACEQIGQRYSAHAQSTLNLTAQRIATLQRRLGVPANDSIGQAGSNSLEVSAASMENWGLKPGEVSEVNVYLWAHQIPPSAAKIAIHYDRTFAKKNGFVAFYVTFKHNEKEEPLLPSFFVSFKDRQSPRFEAWLDERLRQAVYRWQNLLG
jgi:fido (protein-threonine AMPylation protein)